MPNQQPDDIKTNAFYKGLHTDMDPMMQPEGTYIHARNAASNTHLGEVGSLSSEPANLSCATLPYQFIGAIPVPITDQWIIFTTNDINSEIGLFTEETCEYKTIVNSRCLGFNRNFLITGAARQTFDCSILVYWDDGNQPSRKMDINNPPFITNKVLSGGCYIDVPTTQLDCEALRLAPLLTIPCLTLTKSVGAGTLPNGTYQVVVAYAINQIRVTDFLIASNPVSIFSHSNLAGAIKLDLSNQDQSFDEMIVVVVSTVNGQTVAKQLGIYSTRQGVIYIDTVGPELITVPLELIPIQNPSIEKSDNMYTVGDYLLRVGSYTKPEFNYQPIANQIKVNWAAVEYPANYHRESGINVGHAGDEQYAYFVRWVHNTGEKTASYHIPGRAKTVTDSPWTTKNTATVTSLPGTVLPDGGVVIATGDMGYWESTEFYPDDKANIYAGLCGLPIRHHKFPDATVSDLCNHYNHGGDKIRVLGVQFSNIAPPLDNNGIAIPSIVGYEILRGSREGHKTIIAKGMLNNMRTYVIPGTTNLGVFSNYPYNDLRITSGDDRYLVTGGGYRNDMFSFHSPDTDFQNPAIGGMTLKIYEEVFGTSSGKFSKPYKHPQFKLLTDFSSKVSAIAGVFSTAAILTNGVSLGATQDVPFSFSIGPIPPLPTYTDPIVGPGSTTVPGFGLAAAIVNETAWLLDVLVTLAAASAMGFVTADKILEIIYGLIPYREYAAQFDSHAFYNDFKKSEILSTVADSGYVKSSVQTFNTFRVNNLYRDNYVTLLLNAGIADPGSASGIQDTSRYLSSQTPGIDNFTSEVQKPVVSYYGALKVNIPSQYGQLESIRQIPISNCVHPVTPIAGSLYTSPILFGGDVYVNRYTQKNPMPFFNDWLMGQPDGTEYDYKNYYNIPSPKYSVTNRKVFSDFLNHVTDYRSLDGEDDSTFYVNSGWFYLFCNGVRDFFVESEVNAGFRDWEDEVPKRFYDPYGFTDLTSMFRSDVIKSSGFYKYDYSLSISRFYNQLISWGTMLPLDYDPEKAFTCFQYEPRRIRYSLPQSLELKRDNWQSFLANNYKDFPSNVTSIKPVNKTGALIMMQKESPIQITGVDTLQTGLGTKVTIGDGGLFNQPLQSVMNTDKSYQYGSCQGRFSVSSTPHGIFWVSQEQGKVLKYANQVEDITRNGMKWWFAKYLPSRLLKQFPSYSLYDNPVVGVGCQSVYDNTNEILYITKKDCELVDPNVQFDPVQGFYYLDGTEQCPPGYSLVGGQCVKNSTIDPINLSPTYIAAPSTFTSYGTVGTSIYDSGYSVNGTGTYTLVNTNAFWRWVLPPSGCPTWGKPSYHGECDNGPVNRIMIWNNDGKTNYTIAGSTNRTPVDQWIGFDYCLTINTTKTYYVALAADNAFKLIVDGTVLVSSDPIAMTTSHAADPYLAGSDTVTSRELHLYPVTLTAGSHIITMQGNNYGGAAGFGAEIYDNTKAQIIAATSYDTLTVLFTTAGKTAFTSNMWGCPQGTTLVAGVTPCAKPSCVENLAQPVTIKRMYISACDPRFFKDASWTASYDLKNNTWVSLHDWHPDFLIPTKTHFISAKATNIYNIQTVPGVPTSTSQNSVLWKHNERCDLYCNFYGVDYPFEVGFNIPTGQQVNTLRSIEYILEAYRNQVNCFDKFQAYDVNFNKAMIWNNEQLSGWLNLHPIDHNDPLSLLQYPKINLNAIDIQYSKVEQKYRFNQFWDITKDRGEFTMNGTNMFLTDPTGYKWDINPNYVDYFKSTFERKKFRNYNNKLLLRKDVCGPHQLVFKLSNEKLQNSPR